MTTGYQRCTKTVMDTIADPDIRFDENGISNYYYDFQQALQERVFTGAAGEQKLQELISAIKASGKGKPYDCVMGISGGVDSTYVALKAKEYGLRPLAVHFDNGWNSELSVKNIENIVTKLDLDLHTLVVDWEEFKDVQLSFIKASVIDIEVVTDHAIIATLHKLAKQYGLRYILSGANVNTEYLMPPSWIYSKSDHENVLGIHKQFGTVPLKTFPIFDNKLKKYCQFVLKTEYASFLNYIPYHKQEVKEIISRELGWRDYGGKHYESIFTKFYQAHILPTKFKVDKRKPHLSNLICAGQLSRDAALAELDMPIYDPTEFKQDYEFVLKKFGLTDAAFQELMDRPVKSHRDYPTERALTQRYPVLKIIRPLLRAIKGK